MSDIRPVTEIPEVMACAMDLEPDQQVLDVVILARVTDFKRGGTALAIGISPGVDFIIQNGLILSAYQEMQAGAGHQQGAA